MPPFIANIFRVTRPLSNVKNIAIVLFAYFLSGTTLPVTSIVLPILALSLVCSAMYAINSLTDVDLDKRNNNKRIYASAVANIGKTNTLWLVIVLTIVGMILGHLINTRFLAALIGLVVTALCYSAPPFRFKERVFLDILFGATLTFSLRFLGSWVAVSAAAPPLLPLFGLILGKSGVHILYKELDHEDLAAAHIQNTITRNTKRTNIRIALTLITLSIVTFLGMTLTADYGVPWLGTVPQRALLVLPLSIPPMIVLLLQATGVTTFNNRVLRVMGLLYTLGVVALVWVIL